MEKILYIITQSEWGGAQRYVFDLARLFGGQAQNLQKSQDYQVHIASSGNGPLLTRLEAQKLPTTRLKHLVRPISPYHDLMAYFELKKLLHHIKPDIVHLNSSKAGFIGALVAKSCGIKKVIYTAHGFVFNEPLPAWKKWLYKTIELFISKRIDKIICVSDYDRQSGIAAGIEPNKLITIHNGIDDGAMSFLPREQAILSLRGAAATKQSQNKNDGIASLPLVARNDRWIGTIANFYPTKGLDVLIEAMAKIDAQLVIIGDGPEEQKLKVKSKKLKDKIIFAGSVENASQYLKAFDLFVLPSRKEGLPYALLEAAAADIPIVATTVGGVPEIIKDGYNGYLAEPDNVADLTKKINLGLIHPLPSALTSDFILETMIAKTLTAYSS